MNKLELSGFMNLMNKIKESEETITISEFFDSCINKVEENYIKKWFVEFKSQIEEDRRVLKNRRVNHADISAEKRMV